MKYNNEPGFEINTINYPSFRFDTLTGKAKLSNHNFGDMDIAWYQIDTNTLYICEFKDLTKNISEEKGANCLINNLLPKSVATASMIISIKYKLGLFNIFEQYIPQIIIDYSDFNIEMYHVVKTKNRYLSGIHKELSNRFEPYKKLFKIKEFAVISGNQGERKFPEIIKLTH